VPADPGGPAAAPGTGRAGPLPPARRRWPLGGAIVALILLGGLAVAMLLPSTPNGYLDPGSGAADGSHALTDILGERGFQVTRAYSPDRALAAVGTARRTAPAATLVITSPGLLTATARRQLAGVRADLLIVAPGPAALGTLAPSVFVASHPGADRDSLLSPRCGLTAARLAGTANVAGYTYSGGTGTIGCYPSGGYPSLVSFIESGRTVTILGSGDPLSNAYLGRNGNAALALNLLSATRRIVWLTPEPPQAVSAAPGPGQGGAGRSGPSLLPAGVLLLLLQLCVAVLLTALWRARRFGPLITERLPVVVRASETVEGHARLYQARRARERAAQVLRDAMLDRVRPAVGLARDATPDAVVDLIASRSRLIPEQVGTLLHGPPPGSDAELVDLARSLDELEREVCSQ